MFIILIREHLIYLERDVNFYYVNLSLLHKKIKPSCYQSALKEFFNFVRKKLEIYLRKQDMTKSKIRQKTKLIRL